MQGIPGSGKSTMADHLAFALGKRQSALRMDQRVVVLSTDDWRYDGEGTYQYDPVTNAMYHRECQKACVEYMQDRFEHIIIDNTNITRWQAEPYIVAARIYEYLVQVVRVTAETDLAVKRQLDRPEDRRVPEHVIRSMHEQMEDLL